MTFGQIIDRLIEPFAPFAALRRQSARQAIAQLSTYAAADNGRGNRDQIGGSHVNNGSADLAIIPDSPTLSARARRMVRDSWVAASAVKAASRNVVGTGIVPVPNAHDQDGAPLTKLNDRLTGLFMQWAGSAKNCDIEKRQNLWQKQSQAVEERYAVGETFLVWSYRAPLNDGGEIDQRQPVGLRFQSFEPEQLDLTKQWYGINEVRGGVEIDEDGAPAAYHFWTRNPADYLFRRQMHSVRIPASRVLHYFKQDRVLQTRGVTPLAPVLQEMWDFARKQKATLWTAIMQSCVGMVITKNIAGSVLGRPLGSEGPPRPGEGNGNAGHREKRFDFSPGMVPELEQGEDVKFTAPITPGAQNESFETTTLRGIGAGIGISHGLLARHFDGNYSAARQDMLEDDKQWEPEQDLLIGTVIDPLYVLLVRFAAVEGRLDDLAEEFNLGEFIFDEKRFTAAEHVKPARPWIDPEKEMNAAEKALANHLRTREQLITEMGGRYRHTLARKADEQTLMRSLGLEAPEDKLPQFRRDLVKTIAADRAVGSTVANAVDVGQSLKDEGVPIRASFKQVDAPIGPPGGENSPQAGALNGASNGGSAMAAVDTWSDSFAPSAPPTKPPRYRLAVLPSMNCGTCSRLDMSAVPTLPPTSAEPSQAHPFCRRFNADVDIKSVCDAWEASEVNADTNVNRGRTLPPYPAPGSPPIERNFEAPSRQQFDLAAKQPSATELGGGEGNGLFDVACLYSEDQPRDADGKFGEGGGASRSEKRSRRAEKSPMHDAERVDREGKADLVMKDGSEADAAFARAALGFDPSDEE